MTDCCDSNIYDLECDINKSKAVKQLKAKDKQLQLQINTINQKLGDTGDESIGTRLDNVEACCEDKQDKIDQANTVISEIGDNVTLLKGMITRQDIKINSLLRNVIIDDTYLNFSDWVENVYIPQGESLANKYTQGDIYMNVNQDIGATNATYVCIRPHGSKNPLSANDWQELYYSAPSDVQAILGIDPVEVMHPYKHEWLITINPDKLADMLGQLKALDLSNVNLTLGEVYFDPVIKESLTIQENLTVGNTTTVNKLVGEDARINKACITEMKCDTNFTGTPTFLDANLTGTLDAHDIDADNADIDNACIEKMTCNTDFTDVIPEFGTANVQTQLNTKRLEGERAHIKKACIEEMVCDTIIPGAQIGDGGVTNLTVENFVQEGGTAVFNGPTEFTGPVEIDTVEGDVNFHDTVYAPDINVTNNLHAHDVIVDNTSTFNGPVNINSYFNYIDDKGLRVCVGNVLENSFRPSYGIFKITGSGAAYAGNGSTNILYGLGSNGIQSFNNAQGADAVPYIAVGTNSSLYANNTVLEWDEENTTPGVYLHKDTGFIVIDGTGDDAGIYTIEFNMTIGFDDVSDNTPFNIWSHRAGVVVYNRDNLRGRIIDDKCEAQQNLFKFAYTHQHRYYDQDTGEDSSGSSYRNTDPNTISFQQPDRCTGGGYRSDVVLRVGQYYTYTKTLTIPVSGINIVAPYFKPSAGCAGRGVHFLFSIPTGVWNTGSEAQIFVHKVANLGIPKEYHCDL